MTLDSGRSGGVVLVNSKSFFILKKKLFIYLAVPGLSCSMRDL